MDHADAGSVLGDELVPDADPRERGLADDAHGICPAHVRPYGSSMHSRSAVPPVDEMAQSGTDRAAPYLESQLLGDAPRWNVLGSDQRDEERHVGLVEDGPHRGVTGLGGDALALTRREHVPPEFHVSVVADGLDGGAAVTDHPSIGAILDGQQPEPVAFISLEVAFDPVARGGSIERTRIEAHRRGIAEDGSHLVEVGPVRVERTQP